MDLLSRCGAVLANQVAQAPRTPALALRVEYRYAHGEVVWLELMFNLHCGDEPQIIQANCSELSQELLPKGI